MYMNIMGIIILNPFLNGLSTKWRIIDEKQILTRISPLLVKLEKQWGMLGYCSIDKSKQNTVKFVGEDDISRHVRDPFLKNIELSGGIYDVVKSKKSHS